MIIREFKESDSEAVSKLSNENSQFFQFPQVTPEFIKGFCGHPRFKLFVLEDGGIVGFCGVKFEDPKTAELGPLCVSEGRRLRGLGSMLVDHVLDFLKPMNPGKVIIKVRPSNTAAIRFFEELGFVASGSGKCHGDIPALLMEWTRKKSGMV
jgi:ribosomal-protein-alanine N-acetyltransferase